MTTIILTIIFAVGILNYNEVIDFGVGHVIARLWALIPLLFGLHLLKSEDPRRKKSGVVLTVIFGFLLTLNIVMLFTETQNFLFYITIIGLLLFWPIIIIVLLVSIIIGFFQRGELTHKSILANRKIHDPDWDQLDTTLITIFGKLTFVIDETVITHRTIRLDILSLFGKVEVIVPEGVGILAETKQRLGKVSILDSDDNKFIGKNVIEKTGDGENNRRLLLVTSSWLGNVTVKRAN